VGVDASRAKRDIVGAAFPSYLSEMTNSLQSYVESTSLEAERIAVLTGEIHAAVLSGLKYLDGPNFLKIHPSALETDDERRRYHGGVQESEDRRDAVRDHRLGRDPVRVLSRR
jgi:hypothetical protein